MTYPNQPHIVQYNFIECLKWEKETVNDKL